MPVWSSFRNFFNRHKNKFLVSGLIITGTILLTKYAQQKLREWQEQHAREYLERTRKQQHFESTERTCNQTILSLLNPLVDSLSISIDTDTILEEIKKNPKNKLQLWEELKIKVFAKVTCFIYLAILLVITYRVQLGVLGGYLFKNPDNVSCDVQEKYLLLCHELLNSGAIKLTKFLETEYSRLLDSVSLKKPMTLVDLEKMFWEIQTAVRNSISDPVEHMKQYIIFPNEKDFDCKIYQELIQDTADILDSDEVKVLASSCVSKAFIFLGDKIAEYYRPPKDVDNIFVHPSQIQVALAKLIPIISGLTRNSVPEQFLQQLILDEKLKILSANIYEAYS